MVAWIISGLPASGKGTQCGKIASLYDWVHLDTGENLRREMQQQTSLAQEATRYISRGGLVPDFLIRQLMAQMLEKHTNARGLIFDGFPRTLGQARILEDFTQQYHFALKGMICLEIDQEEIIRRIQIRAVQGGRKDDQDRAVIQKRIDDQTKQLLDLKGFYEERNKFFAVDGSKSVEEVFGQIRQIIDDAG